MMNSSLSVFHPLIHSWFLDTIGSPTDIQEKAWPEIASGGHVLITAPTGSGKTLTAFLWALNKLILEEWTSGVTSVLYISPLKALNNDIQRNLLGPLDELKDVFEKAGEPFPDIRVLTRSGDTPQADRRRMQRHPPEILITTPESLNLLLSSIGGRSILTHLSTTILDEIHAVFGNRRGVHLITAVDRLVPLSGEFQRIALSATVRPLETVAEFVGGYNVTGMGNSARYLPRPVAIIESSSKKRYDVVVRFPKDAVDLGVETKIWDPMVDDFKKIVGGNRSTLLFTNSRQLSEEITYRINKGSEEPVAYAHHGSLSREIRAEVESKLKAGDLKAIVATCSLEMGIDIGSLDEVVLIQSPHSVSSTIQRVGRAGHRVGQVSQGTLFPTHSQDILEAAVLTVGILSQNIESVKPVQRPLDVLAQVLVSMVGVETWDIDDLFDRIRTSFPYRDLGREQFDLVLNMLAGRYRETRIRELRPRVSIDRLDNTAKARPGALQDLYLSGGTIPNRGYFHLRHQDTNSLIGELDEEFVWEASVGQTFMLGTQNWKIQRITHNDVFVNPGNPHTMAPPFYKAEGIDRDYHLSCLIGEFLEKADASLDYPGFHADLQNVHCLDETAAGQLIGFLENQKKLTGELPHRHHLLVEIINAGPGGAPGNQVMLHTFWGGCVNRPYGLALEAAWEARFGYQPEIYVHNDCIALVLPHPISGDEVLSLVTPSNVEPLLRQRLERSGFFGARFRECAGRALLLSRRRMNERMPLWLSRLKSQKLMEAVLQYEDFPILLETWRTCLQDEFDMENLRKVLAGLESGEIAWTQTRTDYPSPMARTVSWRQINKYMYMDDTPPSGKTSNVSTNLLRDMVFSPGLRPAVSPELIRAFELKRQRLSAAYSPGSADDLLDWVKERTLIPESEWNALISAIRTDHNVDPRDEWTSLVGKLVRISPPGAIEPLIIALELLPRIAAALYNEDLPIESLFPGEGDPIRIPDPTPDDSEDKEETFRSLIGEWLTFYGTKSRAALLAALGVEGPRLQLAMEDLLDSQKIIIGQLVSEHDDEVVCDSDNFETLLRIKRAEAIPAFEPLDIDYLPLFLAAHHGIADPKDTLEGLSERIEQLLCYHAPAAQWESEILPARLRNYNRAWLDNLFQEGNLKWVGRGIQKVAFCFEPDLDLFDEEIDRLPVDRRNESDSDGPEPRKPVPSDLEALFPDASARYDFSTLMKISNLNSAQLAENLWKGVWHGRVTNDTFSALRKGILNRFQVPDLGATNRGKPGGFRSRTGFARWKNTMPFTGNWHLLQTTPETDDLIEKEERNKDRVRLLLDRHGILFRELLRREAPAFQWSKVFRSLRLMELSGEVLTGFFFRDIPGPQFISPRAFRKLRDKLPEDSVYWMNATDPASLLGVQIDALKGILPSRIPSTHLVYRGTKIVAVSQRYGRVLTFHEPPEDPRIQEYLIVLRHLLTREFQALHTITVETVNDQDAAQSPYVEAFRVGFDVRMDYKAVKLFRKT